MITYEHYRSGALYGIRYWIDPGSRIPMHRHDHDMLHNVVVLEGLVEVRFEGRPSLFGSSGNILDFDSSQPHEIVAQEYSQILNLYLHGAPPGYLALPPEELQGVIP